MPRILLALAVVTFFAASYIVIGRVFLSGDSLVVLDTDGERIQARRLLRPFIGTLLLVSFLPRFPAAFLSWYIWIYRPAIERGEAARFGPQSVESRWRRGNVVVTNMPHGQLLAVTLTPARALDVPAVLAPEAARTLAAQDEAHAATAGLSVSVALRNLRDPNAPVVEFAAPMVGASRVVLPPAAALEYGAGPTEARVHVRKGLATIAEHVVQW
jgi:hypothetical protein